MSELNIENSNKLIHYCWFGGKPLSDLTKRCIETWKKFLPDFEIKEWNEKNFDVHQCPFVEQAYQQKKWAFVADYTRFKVLEEHGGLYLDTDMEITEDISKYLQLDFFVGREDSLMINAAVVWAKEKHNKHVAAILKQYEEAEKFNISGDLYETSIPRIMSKYFEEYGFDRQAEGIQVLDENSVYVYPMEYFYPLSYDYQNNVFTDNTCMIHHFDATWISKMEKFKTEMKRKNMKWVVHIIDFFINVKNHINSFINHMDISIFISMFIILLLTAFSFMPIDAGDVNSSYIFNNIKEKYNVVIFQIFLISLVWTFICQKLRLININQLYDKITGTDPDESVDVNEKKTPIISEDMKKIMKKCENRIYLFEIILTLIISILPVISLFLVVPQKEILYSILMLLVTFFLYTGIRKNFKYRILDLLPLGILLTFLAIYMPLCGGILAVIVTALVIFFLFKNKVTKKRKIAFIATIILFALFFITTRLMLPNLTLEENNKGESISFNTNITNLEKVEIFNTYTQNSQINTEFNAGKNLFGKTLSLFIEKLNILITPTVLIYISIILVILLILINKDARFIILALPCILNTISFKSVAIFDSKYALTNGLLLAILVLFLLLSINRLRYTKKLGKETN